MYVDDFKMAGPVKAVAEGWKLIQNPSASGTKGLKLDPPKAAAEFLGCKTREVFAPKDFVGVDCLPKAVTGIRVMPNGEVKEPFQTKML